MRCFPKCDTIEMRNFSARLTRFNVADAKQFSKTNVKPNKTKQKKRSIAKAPGKREPGSAIKTK